MNRIARLATLLMALGITSDYFRVVWLNIWLGHGSATIGFTWWPWFEWYIEPLILVGVMLFFATMLWLEARRLRKPHVPQGQIAKKE